MKRTNVNEMNQKLDAIIEMISSMNARVSALESAKTKVATPKKSATKSTKTTAKKTTKATNTTKVAPKKSSAKKTAPVDSKEKATKSKGVNLLDFEPCKFKDSENYVWGGAKGYKAMRSAYCYAKQTNGKAKNLAEARKLGVQIDFDKAWAKAKSEFEKKYKYVKAEDRVVQ